MDEAEIAAVGSQAVLSVKAQQLRTGRPPESYVARGLDREFLQNTTFGLGAMARGYESAREVWTALADRRGLAVVDATVVPRRDNWGFAVRPDFQLSGLFLEDGVFDPIPTRSAIRRPSVTSA